MKNDRTQLRDLSVGKELPDESLSLVRGGVAEWTTATTRYWFSDDSGSLDHKSDID